MLKNRKMVALFSSLFVGLFVILSFYQQRGDEVVEALDERFVQQKLDAKPDSSVIHLDTNYSSGPGVKTTSPAVIAEMVARADITLKGFEQFVERKPNSLQDVPSPSPLGLDQNGHLIVDMRVRNLFEHYLSAIGEEDLDSIILRIKYDLSSQLDKNSLDEALEVMTGYLQYRNYLGVLKNDFAADNSDRQYDLDAVRNTKLAARDARISFLSEAAIEGMFAQDDEYDDYMMARARVMADSALSPEEKVQQVAEITSLAPAWIAESYAPSQRFDSVRSQTKLLVDSGAGESEVYALRDQVYGAEAAERLSTLDARRADWQNKVDAYRVELDSLLAGSNLDELGQDVLSSLRAQFFEGPELQRIAAIDKMDLAEK